MTRSRYATVTASAGVIVGVVVVYFFHAPVVPALFGVGSATIFLLLRRPAE